jgi:hypothetical protein
MTTKAKPAPLLPAGMTDSTFTPTLPDEQDG